MNPPDADLPAQRFARALMFSGVGVTLYRALREQFGDIKRDDVFWGCALAISDKETALVAAEYEINCLRQRVDQLQKRGPA